MTKEQIEEISQEYEDYFRENLTNEVIKGLNILAKYSDDVSVNPAHDEIFAGIKNEELEKMTEEDVHEMFKLNWRWDEESFAIFT